MAFHVEIVNKNLFWNNLFSNYHQEYNRQAIMTPHYVISIRKSLIDMKRKLYRPMERKFSLYAKCICKRIFNAL